MYKNWSNEWEDYNQFLGKRIFVFLSATKYVPQQLSQKSILEKGDRISIDVVQNSLLVVSKQTPFLILNTQQGGTI